MADGPVDSVPSGKSGSPFDPRWFKDSIFRRSLAPTPAWAAWL